MRIVTRAAVAATLAATLLQGPRAAATECTGTVASTCINVETLWPDAGPVRYATLPGTAITPQGKLSAGLVFTYGWKPLVLTLASPGGGGSESVAVENLTTANFLFAYGLTRNLSLDLALPATFYQEGAGLSAVTGGPPLSTAVLRDLRYGFSLALVPWKPSAEGGEHHWGVTLRGRFTLPTGNSAQFAGEQAAVYVPSVSVDYLLGRLAVGIDFGARIRPSRDLLGTVVGTQLTAGVGVAYDLLRRHKLLTLNGEARALPTLSPQEVVVQTPEGAALVPGGKAFIPAEWLVGVRSAPFNDRSILFELAGGGAIPLTGEVPPTTPAVRALLGVRYVPEAR